MLFHLRSVSVTMSLCRWSTHTHDTVARQPTDLPSPPLSHSLVLYSVVSLLECMRRLWWSNMLECSISSSRGIVLGTVPINWHSRGCDVIGITGCILLYAAASHYTAPSSRLLVLSSLQVWRQSVQVDDHHLCPGVPLNLVYDVIDPGDDDIRAFPACLRLGCFASLSDRVVQPHCATFLKTRRVG